MQKGDWFKAHATLVKGVAWDEDHTPAMTAQLLMAAIRNSSQGPMPESWFKFFLETYDALHISFSANDMASLFETVIYNRRFDLASVIVDGGLDLMRAAQNILGKKSHFETAITMEERLTSFLQFHKNKHLEAALHETKVEITQLRQTVADLVAHTRLNEKPSLPVKSARKAMPV